MDRSLTETIKKKVKEWREEYLKYKGRKETEPVNRDNSLKAESTEDIKLGPLRQGCCNDNSTVSSKQSSPVPCSSKHSCSSNSQENAIESSRNSNSSGSSLDSGLSKTPPESKKLRKLQFSSKTDEVHVFEVNTLGNVCTDPLLSKGRLEEPMLCKTKVFEVPFPEKVSYRNNMAPSCTTPPQKPPRMAQNLKKLPVEAYNDLADVNQTESAYCKDSLDEDGYSIPLNIKEDEMSSTSIKEPLKVSQEHLYAEVTPRSSRNVEKLFTSVDTKQPEHNDNKPQQVQAEVTPRSSEYMLAQVDQYYASLAKSPKPHKCTSPAENSGNKFNTQEVSSPCHVTSTIDDSILANGIKENLNMIHQTDWNLKVDDLVQKHDCHHKNKKPEEASIEDKFVINMFQSRPSKRWEKHVRDSSARNEHNQKFERTVWKRLSLDSRKQKTKNPKANLPNNSFGGNGQEIDEMEDLSKKIQRQLKLMEEEGNDAYSKMLEKQKLRIENRLVPFNNNDDGTSLYLKNESRRIDSELEQITAQRTEEYKTYKKLRKARNIQCIRMTQASKVLEEIRCKVGKKDWLEVLLAERALLETSEKVKVLSQHIRDTTYSIIPEPIPHRATLHLYNMKFPFAKEFRGNCRRERHYTEFFVMTLSCGNEIYVSEFVTGEMQPLIFSNTYTFRNVLPEFEIKLKLFCLKLRTFGGHFWDYFTQHTFCPTSRIIYEDLLTQRSEDKIVYKTSFKLCAETTLTKSNINEYSASLDTVPEVFCKLEPDFKFNLSCDDIDIVANLSGFLDVGTLLGETYYWERKWCVLNGTNFMIYNYPQEEEFGKPSEQVNLEYCFGPIVTKVENCPKRRAFHLKTGRPNNIINSTEGTEVCTLKTKPNFTLRKFYFAASHMDDYFQWTVELEKILNSLTDFKKLAFGEEYVEYMNNMT